jgi:serine/threonine-protein kinase
MDTASPGPDDPRETTDGGHEQASEQAIVLHDTYRLVRQVGFGGTGVVYEAMHTRLPRRFAIKVLLRSLLAHPEAHARFCHEAELMSQLRHPHVVQIFDFNVTHENQPYFVMEYLEGRDLETELAGGATIPLARVVPIVEAVASALMAAHRHDIVHRDLKPSNIFLCDVDDAREGNDGAPATPARAEHPFVKVLDFGVSPAGAVARLALGANIVGTPHYMAPEQATGRGKSIDARADQFTLAAITYAMLTGRDAFSGEDVVSVLYQIVHEEPPPLDRYVHGSWDTRLVQQILSRAMAKDPALRFPTVVDFADALRDAADHAHAPATPPPVVVSAPRPAAPLDAPASGQPWSEKEITQSIPRVPRLAYRPIVFTLALAAAVGFVALKGWMPPLPGSVVMTARAWKVRLLGPAAALPTPVPSPASASTSTTPAPAPVTGIGEAASPAPAAVPITPTPTPTPTPPGDQTAMPTQSQP